MLSILWLRTPFWFFNRGSLPNGDDILQQDDMVKLKRCIFTAQVRYIVVVEMAMWVVCSALPHIFPVAYDAPQYYFSFFSSLLSSFLLLLVLVALLPLLFLFFLLLLALPLLCSPWYNRNGWLGVKHQVTDLLTSFCVVVGADSSSSSHLPLLPSYSSSSSYSSHLPLQSSSSPSSSLELLLYSSLLPL